VKLHIDAVIKVKLRAQFSMLLETATWLCCTRTDARDAWIAVVDGLVACNSSCRPVLFVSWSGFMAMKERTEHFRHLLLVIGRPIIVTFDWIVGLVASDWFNVPHLTFVVRKNGHWSCPEAMIREVRLDPCSRAHYRSWYVEF